MPCLNKFDEEEEKDPGLMLGPILMPKSCSWSRFADNLIVPVRSS